MAVLPKVDVVFVGFGLVGGIIANELGKRTTLNMVALERGPFRDTHPDLSYDHFDEWRYTVQSELFQDLSKETITFRNDYRQTALPMRRYGSFLPGNGVGGAAVHWNGQNWRFLPHQFRYRSHLVEHYRAEVLPPDSTIQDWPVSYEELEPYYTQFEFAFGIAGKAGNIQGRLQPGGNPFEGPRSTEFPQPPNQIAYGPTLFRDACAELGFHPFPQPTATSPGAYTNPDGMSLGPCDYCGFCERFGCHVGAKASPILTVIPSALRSGRVEVRPNSYVALINHAEGRALSVLYHDASGALHEQPADLIVLGAWTLNNPRLLLLSEIGEPYDPVQERGVVGRNYSYQVLGANAVGWYHDRILNRFMGSGANGYTIDEFNGDNFDHSGLGFIGGGNIAFNNTGARPIGQYGPLPDGVPSWGTGWKAGVQFYYNRIVSFGLQGESPAYRGHYLDRDPTYCDAFGYPLLRMTFNFTENERRMCQYIAEKALAPIIAQMNPAIQRVSAELDDYNIVPYQSTHCNGGTVMGDDPSTSVVNRFCQVWGMPNLFVVGASNFPQNPGYNPTGTVGALAYWVADAIVTRYLQNPGMLA